MSVEENKAIISRIWDECNKGNLEVIDDYFADNFVRYDHNGQIMDRAGYKRMCTFIVKSIPDFHVTIDDMIGEGEKIAFRMTLTGTNTGAVGPNPPTGKKVTYKEVYFARFEKGKVVEYVNLNRDISPP
jgi:predicted ester cyclase